MKKTRFFLMALLLAAVLMFTGCGSRDDNNNQVADERGNVQRDVNDGNDNLGEDIRNDMKNATNDVRNGADRLEDNIASDGTTRTVE